jgi:hypothetical protein
MRLTVLFGSRRLWTLAVIALLVVVAPLAVPALAFAATPDTELAKLVATDAVADHELGAAVAIDGSTVVAGAEGDNSWMGAAYVFVQSAGTWSQQAKLIASGTPSVEVFGQSVSISGDTIVVGADDSISTAGAAYVFVRSGSTWTQEAKLTAFDSASGDAFGRSVGISG